MPLSALPYLIAGYFGISVFAVAAQAWPQRSRAVYGAALALSALLLLLSGIHLLTAAAPATLVLPLGLPWLGAHFRLDALAAFFLVVINLGGVMASLYAIGYGQHEHAPGRVLPFFPLFLAGMNLVLLADDAFTFLLSWEFMSLSSWALVVAHHREPANTRAGFVYLLMAGFGTFALLLAFGLLAGAEGGYAFAAIRAAQYAPATAAWVFLLALIGAGSKAGIAPLHAWLPLAHPAAPSHVSALMSGVMTKVALYGLIRIVFDLLGEPAWWWGEILLVLGGASAALGVLYALLQNDLKVLLAYSTVENIGIIAIGLGLALAFQANGLHTSAALALGAALLHALNHSLFKSALFFGAGAVLAATGERDLERLGGLIHRLPRTAFAFLIACAAISALPPLNGFASEWLTFQAILVSPELPQWGLKFSVPAVGALLALAAALAATCFVRAFGIAFLGRPRSAQARDAVEVEPSMWMAMGILAALCLLIGILPGLVLDVLAPVVASLGPSATLPLQSGNAWWSLVPLAASRSSYNGWLVLVFMLVSGWLTAYAIHRWASRETRRGAAWDCGFPNASPLTQYTAGSFSQPIRRAFGTVVFQAREIVFMPPPGDIRPARFEARVKDWIWDSLYAPIARLIGFAAERLNVLQFLTIRRYLTLTFAALVILLGGLALWR
ncbi:MAG: hydrogenase 4 subunit B [Gammaproteobacteria bacterium]